MALALALTLTTDPKQALGALPPDEIIAELLRRKDAGIAASLAGFEAEQALTLSLLLTLTLTLNPNS